MVYFNSSREWLISFQLFNMLIYLCHFNFNIITKHTCCVPQSKVYRLSINHHIRRIVIESDDIIE